LSPELPQRCEHNCCDLFLIAALPLVIAGFGCCSLYNFLILLNLGLLLEILRNFGLHQQRQQIGEFQLAAQHRIGLAMLNRTVEGPGDVFANEVQHELFDVLLDRLELVCSSL